MRKNRDANSVNGIESKANLLNDPKFRSIAYQLLALLTVGIVGYYLFANTSANLKRQAIATGFSFLQKEAAFEIGEAVIAYSPADTYLRALFVGALNTVKVAFIGIILTTILGTFIGIARLSKNWLVSRLAGAYVELFQDIPILLQLFFWYSLFCEILPSPKAAIALGSGIFLSNRGMLLAVPEWNQAYQYVLVAFAIGILTAFFARRAARSHQKKTGQILPTLSISSAIIVGFPLFVWLFAGAPLKMSVPHLSGFNFQGGLAVSPEFSALLLGLVLYTAAFVAEIVRAGIQAIGHGQTEAAISLGLKPSLVLRLVILPQALRVIIPPLTSQMLNLTKNSSLAVAIGFPDFVSVASTTINQTGQAIEGILMIMTVYLFFSLVTSLFMNWYNKKMALVER
ncbi:MAG: amino acid ABC transporter permease [Syntrophobacterales bacterium]|nr:amino acid ABC transporter permease [Syntrophobacterales bacterium]